MSQAHYLFTSDWFLLGLEQGKTLQSTHPRDTQFHGNSATCIAPGLQLTYLRMRLRIPTSQHCYEGYQMTKIMQFGNELDGLYSRQNNLETGGVYSLPVRLSSAALSWSKNELHGEIEEAVGT